jgi:hypothetical protein
MAKKARKKPRPVECRPDPDDPNKFWWCLDGENEVPITVQGLDTPEQLEWFAETIAKFLWDNRHKFKRDASRDNQT